EGALDKLVHAGVEESSNPSPTRFARHSGLTLQLNVHNFLVAINNVDVKARLAAAASSQASGRENSLVGGNVLYQRTQLTGADFAIHQDFGHRTAGWPFLGHADFKCHNSPRMSESPFG